MTDSLPTHPASTDSPAEGGAVATPDTLELRRKAEAATPGPWKACGTIYEHMNCEVRGGVKGEGQGIAQVWDGPNAFKDGQWIAAANPAVILALLDRLDALEGQNVRMREALSALIISDQHRPIGGVTSAEWIRLSLKPAIKLARAVMAPTTLADEGRDQ